LLTSDAVTDKLADYLAGAIELKLEQETVVFSSAGSQHYETSHDNETSHKNETGHEDETSQGLVEFRLSAQHAFAHPKDLSVQFPTSLNDALVSVVQPQYGPGQLSFLISGTGEAS
jgi:hypothetical protein